MPIPEVKPSFQLTSGRHRLAIGILDEVQGDPESIKTPYICVSTNDGVSATVYLCDCPLNDSRADLCLDQLYGIIDALQKVAKYVEDLSAPEGE